METQSLVFILVMAAIAAIGLVAFCVYLVVQRIERTARDSGQQSVREGPRWFEYLLAVLVLVAVIVAVVVIIVFLYPGEAGAGEIDAGIGFEFDQAAPFKGQPIADQTGALLIGF